MVHENAYKKCDHVYTTRSHLILWVIVCSSTSGTHYVVNRRSNLYLWICVVICCDFGSVLRCWYRNQSPRNHLRLVMICLSRRRYTSCLILPFVSEINQLVSKYINIYQIMLQIWILTPNLAVWYYYWSIYQLILYYQGILE